jgi:geranylgeranyl diphosphate synthase type I
MTVPSSSLLGQGDRSVGKAPPEPTAPLGLADDAGLADVDALMTRLAVGPRLSRSGQMVQEHLATGGKRVRARLALAAGEALGVERERVVPWAAACELLHNATLIHDDVQDGDTLRRDQPTTWVRHGVPQAINAGDLMLMLPFLALGELRVSGDMRWRLSHALASSAALTVRGQSLEMELLQMRHFGWEDFSRAGEGKTGAFFGLPVHGAALLAGLDDATAARFAREFVHLGTLFQLQDDLLDLTDRKGRGGRRGSDLAEGKVSALVVEHLARHPADTDLLLALLETPRESTPQADIDAMIARFHTGGAVAAVKVRAERIAATVLASPLLTAVPHLHQVAAELVSTMEASIRSVASVDGSHPQPLVLRSKLA